MSFLKNVLHDLVEKRLWPVAIALVAALVAVPIVLGGSSSSTGSPATDVAAVTAPNGLANHRDVARAKVISLEEQAAGKVERSSGKKIRDPFVQHHQPKPVKLAAIKSPSSAPSTGALGGGSTEPGGATGGTVPTEPTAPVTTKKPESTSVDTYRVEAQLRRGRRDEEL